MDIEGTPEKFEDESPKNKKSIAVVETISPVVATPRVCANDFLN